MDGVFRVWVAVLIVIQFLGFWALFFFGGGRAHYLIFRKNQFEGPCEDHVMAIKGPYFGNFLEKGTMGYTQNSEIWHEASLGTSIMIQEESIWRTMWGPCFGHKRAIFWPFLGKVDYGINKNWEIWHGPSLKTLILIQEEPIQWTMFWP